MVETFLDYLGLDYGKLEESAQDRAIMLHSVKPDWSRETQVQFIHTGTPELFPAIEPTITNTIKEFFMGTTLPPEAKTPVRAVIRRRVEESLGLVNAAFTEEHEETINGICDIIQQSKQWNSRPLEYLNKSELQALQKLLADLPQVSKVRYWRERKWRPTNAF